MQTDSKAADVRPRLVLVTGLSGSGKSTVSNALEDIGFYCVDNLPMPLLRTFLADPVSVAGGRPDIALIADVRAPGFAEAVPELLTYLEQDRYELIILFLEASEDILVRRFSETRRPHPLATGEERPLVQGVRQERELLADLRGRAQLIFDTSDWSVHDVRREIYREFLDDTDEAHRMVVTLMSFGFKRGIPAGSDLVFDVRFLPNPYFRPGLRELTGRDQPVQAFLEEQQEFVELMERLKDLLLFMLPRYQRENRAYLTVAIGCTGGRHRSVASCEHLRSVLADAGDWNLRIHHRDCDR